VRLERREVKANAWPPHNMSAPLFVAALNGLSPGSASRSTATRSATTRSAVPRGGSSATGSPSTWRRTGCPAVPRTPAVFGTGANMAFDRSFLLDSDGFDEALGAGSRTRGGEDIDKFVDTLLRGRAIAYKPSAIVWHSHRSDRAGLLRQMYGYGTGPVGL